MVCGGVSSSAAQLTELGVPIAPSTYCDHINREPSRRELRDGELKRLTSAASTPPTTVFTVPAKECG